MSLNSLLFQNPLNLYCATLNVSGTASGNIKVAPFVVGSNVFVPNLYVERAKYADFGNLAGDLVGPVTSNGYVTHITATGVTPGTYGSSTQVGEFTVNAAGQITSAVNVTIPSPDNVTGPITIVGNVSSITAQTGAGTIFVTQDMPNIFNPTFTTPHIGVATGTSLSVTGQITTTQPTGTAPFAVGSTTRVANLNVARAGVADTVTTNANLTGPVTSVGNATTIVPTGVSAGTYGDAITVSQVTVNAAGQVTNAANVAITFPAVVNVEHAVWSDHANNISNLTGDVTSVDLATTIAPTGVSAGVYGGSASVGQVHVNAKGQVTAAANVAISFPINVVHAVWSDHANNISNLTGDVTSVDLATTIANTGVSAGVYGGSTQLAQLKVNSKGQVTNAANVALPTTILHSVWSDHANNISNLTGDVTSVDLATTIAPSGVTAGVYGDSTHVPKVVFNAKGQATSAGNVAISFPSAGNLTGPVTSVGLATTITPTTVTAGKYGNATSVPQYTVNAAGQLTQAANVAISFPSAGNLTGPVTSVGLATSITATGVTIGKYGDGTHVAQYTVNAAGQLTQAANVGISFPSAGNLTGPVTSVGLATTIAATGVTSGRYGDSTHVAQYTVNAAGQLTQGANVAINFPSAGNLTGPVTSVGLATTIAATGVSAGKYGNGTNVPQFVVNAAGQLTSAGNVAVSFPTVVTAIAGTANQITASASTGSVTLSTPSSFIAPGSIAATTTLAAQNTTNQVILGTTQTTTLNAPAPAASVTVTLPISSDTLLGRSTTDSLTNKTLTDASDNIIARGLWDTSGSGSVSVYAASAPATGQVLTATNSTTATWQAIPAVNPQVTFGDTQFTVYNATDNTKIFKHSNGSATTGTTTTLATLQTVNRTVTLPDSTDTLIGRSTTDTLINKTLTDNTNNVLARGLWDSSGSGSVSVYAASAPATGQVLTATNSTTATWQSPAAASVQVTFGDTQFTVYNATDNTKIFKHSNGSAATGTTTTLAEMQTVNRTVTLPDATDTLVGKSTTDTLINKTLTATSNNVTASGLFSATTTVAVSSATAPTTGQVLAATSSTAATWQTLGSFGSGVLTVTVPLSSAQIKGLFTTPVQLLAAPGSTSAYYVLGMMISYTFITAAYIGGGTIQPVYGGLTQLALNSSASATTFTAGSNEVAIVPNAYAGTAFAQSRVVNLAINLTNSTAAFTSATGTGTAQVTLVYTVIPL
jgi:hypothetical protein